MNENETEVVVVGDGGGDPTTDQFHRNEAISAVADDGFLAEEEDDDYEDLYNDVNVGEGFLQSLRKNDDDLAFRNDEKVDPTPPQPPVVEDGGGGERKVDTEDDRSVRISTTPGGVEGYNQNVGFIGNERGTTTGGSVTPVGSGGGLRVELAQSSVKVSAIEEQTINNNNIVQNPGVVVQQSSHAAATASVGTVGNTGNVGGPGNYGLRQGGGNFNGAGGNGAGVGGIGGFGGGRGSGGGGGGTILFVGDLHWWTTDAELEAELCKYGPVREVKFFDEKASGKSKGYCQVEFFDPAAATACKEGMNGHVFNGRPCVVAFASPFSVKRMGEAQVNRNQQMAQAGNAQIRRGPDDAAGKIGGSGTATGGNYQGGGDNNRNYQGGGGSDNNRNYQGGGGDNNRNYQGGGDNNRNYQGGGDNNRGYGRGNWGRGNAQAMGNRGSFGPMRNRGGGMGGRGIIGNGGHGFGQGMGTTPPLLHPQSMMGQGFDPAFGGPMGRMGGYGGFPGAPTPPFSGILSSFPPVASVGLPGVAPHVNPAFFGRGMPMNGMGMMPASGVEGHSMGMWSDPNMGNWAGDEHGGRAGESSYGEEAMSEHQYGEVSHDRGNWPNATKEKERGSDREWSGSSDRRYRDDREPGYDREMPREKDIVHDPDWSERRHRDDRDVARDKERERTRDRERSRERERDRDRDRSRDRHRDDRDRFADRHRSREREPEYDDEWDRGRSARAHSKTRISHEEEQQSRSRDADYGKRRRLTSE